MYKEIIVIDLLYNDKQPTFTGGPNFLQGGPAPRAPPLVTPLDIGIKTYECLSVLSLTRALARVGPGRQGVPPTGFG